MSLSASQDTKSYISANQEIRLRGRGSSGSLNSLSGE